MQFFLRHVCLTSIMFCLLGCQTVTQIKVQGSQELIVQAISASTLAWYTQQAPITLNIHMTPPTRADVQQMHNQMTFRKMIDAHIVIFDWQWRPTKSTGIWQINLQVTSQTLPNLRPMNCVAFPFPLWLISTPIELFNSLKNDDKPKRQIEIEKQLMSDFQKKLDKMKSQVVHPDPPGTEVPGL